MGELNPVVSSYAEISHDRSTRKRHSRNVSCQCDPENAHTYFALQKMTFCRYWILNHIIGVYFHVIIQTIWFNLFTADLTTYILCVSLKMLFEILLRCHFAPACRTG